MTNLTEKNLLELGFNRIDVTAEESGGSAYYFFEYPIGKMSLITNDNDLSVDDGWKVYLFDYEYPVFTTYEATSNLINSLKGGKQ